MLTKPADILGQKHALPLTDRSPSQPCEGQVIFLSPSLMFQQYRRIYLFHQLDINSQAIILDHLLCSEKQLTSRLAVTGFVTEHLQTKAKNVPSQNCPIEAHMQPRRMCAV